MKSNTELFESLKKESKDLIKKMDKLDKFVCSKEFNCFSTEDKGILVTQYNAMSIYLTMLNLRMLRIPEEE